MNNPIDPSQERILNREYARTILQSDEPPAKPLIFMVQGKEGFQKNRLVDGFYADEVPEGGALQERLEALAARIQETGPGHDHRISFNVMLPDYTGSHFIASQVVHDGKIIPAFTSDGERFKDMEALTELIRKKASHIPLDLQTVQQYWDHEDKLLAQRKLALKP